MASVVKYVPEWFPGAGFQVQAKVWRKYVMAMIEDPFEYVKQSLVSVNANCVSYMTSNSVLG
jgi:hypothetical protein